MIRSFLGMGDRGGEATVIEGLDSVSCSNPPPRIQISTLYMKTWCNACKQEGYIAPQGPRWPGTGPNGEQWALSGDINICGCTPPPVFFAQRNMSMKFSAEDAARLTGKAVAGASIGTAFAAGYDEQVLTTGDHFTIVGYPYFIETSAGAVHSGRVDARGLLPRVFTDAAASYTVYWGEEALIQEGWNNAE
ncbi:PAAR domain-containing protein [Paraburkholderia phenoliruptrix]|uniref:PAAR motif-containing protein n=1 Tax=Paraburkholderia phenoliruptrix TaxID=252970 RepID=A0A6J5KB66_9BURK|nr:hypothetical protein [Paraburkholderia phenoliruptrix]CAB4051379.1 hypothetical protein LMG9964_05056 [Paraburkholderia phenoliruptrix]